MCASCNTRRMVVMAAHLVEHVYPAVAVQQWVVVLPKRLRHFFHWDAGCPNRVVGIAMREVQRATPRANTCTAVAARTGDVRHNPSGTIVNVRSRGPKIYTLVLTRIIKLKHMRRLP